MAEWKFRGYVPDSDEEDDTSSTSESQHQSHHHTASDETPGGVVDDPKTPENQSPAAIQIDKHEEEVGETEVDKEEKSPSELGLCDLSTPQETDELHEGHYKTTLEPHYQESFVKAIITPQSNPGKPFPLQDPPSSPSSLTSLNSINPSTSASSQSKIGCHVTTEVVKSVEIPSRHLPAPQQRVQALMVQEKVSTGPIRNLRHRNPIQLHPYAIEGEQYRQNLKNRGVKPLRIAQGELQTARGLPEDLQVNEFAANADSQDPTDTDSPSSSLSSLEAQSILASPSRGASRDFNLEDGGELPDIDVILRHMSPKIAFNGRKRRKVMQSAVQLSPGISPRRGCLGPLRIQDTVIGDTDGSLFDIPPSPSRSQTSKSSSLVRSESRGFRFPRGISPVALPTPLTSSEPRRRAASSHDAAHSDEPSSVSESSENESGVSASEPETVDRDRLQGVQRKIRGVLPASWLKLDLQAQERGTKQKNRHRASRSPEKDTVQQRGVARPVAPRQKAVNAPDIPIQVLDSSSDTGSEQEHGSPAPVGPLPSILSNPYHGAALSNDEDLPLPSHYWGEVAEDNRIDDMMPTTTRKGKIGNPSQRLKTKRKRTKLTAIGLQSKHNAVPGIPSTQRYRRKHQSRLPEQYLKSRRPKFRPPDLGLLDVLSQSGSSNFALPSFLRVAKRTVRSRNDKGRSVPDRKYLRLATEIETRHANEYLRSWRGGTLTPNATTQCANATTATRSRDPLQSCTGNVKPIIGHRKQDESLVSKPDTSISVQSRSQLPRAPLSRTLQTSLDPIILPGIQSHKQTDLRAPRPVRRRNAGKQSHKGPIRTGHLLSSLKDPGISRPATLESLQANIGRGRPRSSFLRQLDLTSSYVPPAATVNPLLAKFLANDDNSSDCIHDPKEAQAVRTEFGAQGTNPRRRRPRKREPQQAKHDLYRLSGPSSIETDDLDPPLRSDPSETAVEKPLSLSGLGPFGTSYTATFDVAPLPTGTYFTNSTFIGSGEFAQSIISRDLDQARGFLVIQHGQDKFRWGPWDDSVSTQLGTMMDQACEGLPNSACQDQEAYTLMMENVVGILLHVVRYFTKTLSFYDVVDRISFLQRCQELISRLVTELSRTPCHPQPQVGATSGAITEFRNSSVKALYLCTVLANQLWQISKHSVVPRALQTVCQSFLEHSATHALERAFDNQSAGFAQCRKILKLSDRSPIVLDESHTAVESLVVVSHLLAGENMSGGFLNALQGIIARPSFEARNDARKLEISWERLFLVLPFLEIGLQGVLQMGRRYENSTENWTSVKQLLEPVFEACQSNTHRQASTFNDYCRALFGRCFNLINLWGWQKCESNIGVLFDFFARRSLFNLPNEEAHGSPPFLAHLHQQPSLDVAPEDRCFHIFLKIIGTGLQKMRKEYPERKVRGIIWRLLPNHGRFLPKDQAISQVDLDALRNHHDLLCTLYWASPHGFRPKPTVIQNLVDVENSHKEASRINIRAWSNLVMYQSTAKESLTSLQPFVNWSSDMLSQILRQHQRARTEAEEQVRSAEATDGYVVNKQLLEHTIIQNQRQVEAILSDTLSSIRDAINVAQELEAAKMLLLPSLVSVFNFFDIRSSQITKVVVLALDVFLVFIGKALPQHEDLVFNDDSQDYGDWSAFSTDVLPSLPATPAIAGHLEENFQDPLRELLSNCFGADSPPEDGLLTKVVDTWVALGNLLVLGGARSWADYIGDYGNETWVSLRDTEQTRKFLPYFHAILIDTDRKIFEEHRSHVIKAWAASLVEREAQLKYQHRLTSSLLNAVLDDPILANPPFWAVDGRFNITPLELSERRLLLISNVLSNMRKSVDDAVGTQEIALKADYKVILRVMMNTMKSNYQELGQGSNVCGTYVDFVHRVIELLQQHTSTICPIDRFFTDSSSFPLPADDPMYVVGQLKNYGLRLHDHRTPKQLAMFIQSVSERAAVDGQQAYLVGQLYTAMDSSSSQGASGSPDLRPFLLMVIFPAYINTALTSACGWIMAMPVILATKQIFSSIMADINGVSEENVASISALVMGFLGCLQRSLNTLSDRADRLKQPEILKTVAAYFATLTAVLPALDYLSRISGHDQRAIRLIESFKSFALFAARSLLFGHTDDPEYFATTEEKEPNPQHVDVQAFASYELRETLNRNWICHGGRFYLARGQARREVVVDVGLFEEEKAAVIGEIERFFNVLGRMVVLGSEGRV
ncbi:MAG: hypothetical protein L6R40_004371 [Gallowayella cf. fulva]|nr:MAG: hypothetical protein L6R40_004371 [Xanthomendoza cf. fulva]